MSTYYSLLGVSRTATRDEIKKAFRKKLKQYHPDAGISLDATAVTACPPSDVLPNEKRSSEHHSNTLLEIITASRVLLDSQKRREYDVSIGEVPHGSYITISGQYYRHRRAMRVFDYERFLEQRQHIFAYRAKLFLFDIMHKNGARAFEIFTQLERERLLHRLQKTIGWYNFFDTLFLLAEYCHLRADNPRKYRTTHTKIELYAREALRLYLKVGELESRKAYFKDYMEEVALRVLFVLREHEQHIPETVGDEAHCAMAAWTVSAKLKKEILRCAF